MSTFAIGDIQGCFDELMTLLALVDYDPDTDTLWLTGDLINRGPKNLETMEFVMAQKNVVSVLGNHDLHFLAVAVGRLKPYRKDTFTDILNSSSAPEIIEWFRHRPMLHWDESRGIALVHAGLPPIWDLQTCLVRAAEVEQVLSSDAHIDFLANMYGNDPDAWQENLQGWPRLRMITNFFTRMRYCTDQGRLDFDSKETSEPPGFSPWFRWGPPAGVSSVLFGHWAALEGLTGMDSMQALDTGCVWGRSMTALRIDDGKKFSTPAGISRQVL